MLQNKEISLLKSVEDGTLLNKVDEDIKYDNGDSATADLRKLAKEGYIETQFTDCGWINQMITGITDEGKEAIQTKR